MQQVLNAPGMTKWTNPSNKPTVKLKLYKHPPVIVPHQHEGFPGTVRDTGFLEVEIKPGESCLLPAAFDTAIQKTDADGVVQSGECPWLIKDDVEPELAEALDPVEQQRLQAGADAERARIKAAEAENERFKAEQLRLDAERQQRENDARAKADQEAREQLAADRAEVAKLKADLLKQKAEADKALEALAKPTPDTSSGAGGDSGSGGGKSGGGKQANKAGG